MARYCVQRTNEEAIPPRFEWLATAPEWTAGADGEPMLSLAWTADRNKARDFGREKAGEWAALIEGATLVRFGDAPAEEARDFGAEERARNRQRRHDAIAAMPRAERNALGFVLQQDLDDDARAKAAAAKRRAEDVESGGSSP